MRQSISLVALLAGLSLAALAPREAASQDYRGRDQVCVYEHADYGGWEQCFGVGESISEFGQRNDRISSIRIRGRAAITLFEHTNFQGRDVAINSDVPNLGRWNDQASSLRVSAGGYRERREERRDDRRSFEGRRSGGEDRVCFYEHTNFQGRSECWDSGDEVRDLRGARWNDVVSSVRTFGRTRVVLFADINYGGQRLVIERDVADLTQFYDGGDSWNDRVSSFRVSGGGGRD